MDPLMFIDEIKAQPVVLEDLLAAYGQPGFEPAADLGRMLRSRPYRQYLFTGMGSSFHVGYIASAMLRRGGLRAFAVETREFLSGCLPILSSDTLLVAVSQSGESAEVMELMGRLPGDRNIVTVTNYPDHSLHARGEARFLLYAGEERFTATKSYTNTVAAILYIAQMIALGGATPSAGFFQTARRCAAIQRQWMDDPQLTADLARFFENGRYICLTGGDASYCTASHGELVVEEAGKIFASRYLPAQFLHGPVELISEGFCVLAFDFFEETRTDINRIVDNILSYGGSICVVGNRPLGVTDQRLMSLTADLGDPWFAPLIEVIPVELMVNALGLKRGLDPGVLTRVRK